jgi:hypothetical protein
MNRLTTPTVIAIGGVLLVLLVLGLLLSLPTQPTSPSTVIPRPSQAASGTRQFVPETLTVCVAYVSPEVDRPQVRATPLPDAPLLGKAMTGYYPVVEGITDGRNPWLLVTEPRMGQRVWLHATEVTLYGPCDDMLD